MSGGGAIAIPDLKHLRQIIEPLRVRAGTAVTLPRDCDPGHTARFLSEQDAATELSSSIKLLADYQSRLAAEGRCAVLVVLQALDAAGKDGTIKHVMSGVNPTGVKVHSFKIPSTEEVAHDYLWRYQRELPGRGEIGIFNRSHYEEVLVVRVHPELLDRQRLGASATGKALWTRRFHEINEWERHLTSNGIRVLKMFLNVSKEEQRRRFLARIDNPHKNWKFSAADVRERDHWDAYQKAYSEVLTHTSTPWAPWHIVPADHKWFTRLAAASLVVNMLGEIDPQYPEVSREDRNALAGARAKLEAEG